MSDRSSLHIEAASRTDVGLVREHNEDAYGELSFDGGRLFIVADGMGGHAGGETASRLAVEAIREVFEGASGESGRRLREAMEAANLRVHQASHRDSRLAGMGTTGVALVIDADAAWVANVGDSRVYRLRGSELVQLTRDHSVVAEMVRRGVLTADQALIHPRRNEVLRSLGTSPDVEVDVDRVDVAAGDVFVLCSDGLSGVVDDAAIAAFLDDASPSEASLALVEAAIGQGAPDNVTVQVVKVASERL
jgi:protein phosphatase